MEHETFWTLLKDSAHWEFEIFLMFIFDVLIGLLIWPWLREFFKHHKSDDEKIATLEKEVEELKNWRDEIQVEFEKFDEIVFDLLPDDEKNRVQG